jgi:tetraacyldisaccharide 4'-kinase
VVRAKWLDIVSGARSGAAAAAARLGLGALAIPYAGGVRVRRWLYSRGLFRTRRSCVPVISVGNITAGGTGKTPIVEHLARGLASRGRKPGVVMRGYRTGRGTKSDEATILRANLGEGVPVIENPNRHDGAETAACIHGADVVVLDDGFQHLALARDLDILALDATSPFGFGKLLPAGCLRERPGQLARADVVIVTRADIPPAEEVAGLREKACALAPGALVLESTYRPARLETPAGDEGPPLEDIRHERVAAFCGIGNPHAFGVAVRRLGAEVVLAKSFPDHHPFTGDDLEAVAREAGNRAARLVLTTQKDAARIDPAGWPDGAPPLHVLRAEFAFAGDGEPAFWARVEEALPDPEEKAEAEPEGG